MSQINILVVDDEKEIADLVEIYLVSDGYTVFKANNAMEGLEILGKENRKQKKTIKNLLIAEKNQMKKNQTLSPLLINY